MDGARNYYAIQHQAACLQYVIMSTCLIFTTSDIGLFPFVFPKTVTLAARQWTCLHYAPAYLQNGSIAAPQEKVISALPRRNNIHHFCFAFYA